MRYAIEILEHELNLIEEGLKKWGLDFQDIKKRQESKVKDIKKAIEILSTATKLKN